MLAIAIGAYLLWAGNRVTVPDVVGREAGEAAERLHDRGLEVEFVNRESDEVPRDHVISQDPPAGTEVREGSTVTLTISGGRGTVPVPAVEGRPREEAEQILTDAGFRVRVRQAFSDTVPEGNVISQQPQAGRQATRGRTVTITVSRGVPPVEVPRLIGLSREEAEQQLSNLGLSAEVSERESTRPPGTVLDQDPDEGERVQRGATVRLVVAKARPEVPDVTTGNPPAEEATRVLEQAGYRVVTEERPDPALPGRVIGQRPEPGTPRSTGGTVTIVVGAAPTPTPTPTPTP